MKGKIDLLKLLSVKGVGRVTVKKIVDKAGGPENIGKLDRGDLIAAGVTREKASKILNKVRSPFPEGEKELLKAAGKKYRICVYGSREYPELLKEIYDPPSYLYCDGNLLKEDFNAVAVVGTRRPSQYGLSAARKIARGLARNGITVISGGALGIDAQAHRGALEAGGRTVAVLGSGLDKRHPRTNINLMRRISKNGAVVSEFSPDTEPLPKNFPLRNRVVSGMALATVVVQAPSRSGALITADIALEQGRQVFAVPGSIFTEKNTGCLNLLKEGAAPVSGAEDIIEEIYPVLKMDFLKRDEKNKDKVSCNGHKILKSLSAGPLQIDRIGAETGINMASLASELTELELRGLVMQSAGKTYIKND